ncbi:hypothetical protein GCM10007874_31720 [Labrys miyagiensis]|uniref:Uncharacterized protein n=1 Tax=Labrys miyagiensis TaxID=346912 RepID=A0ABQ6CMP3_9HYPH|nr:hypothetical protein [Labrys miyagiensis]GLS20155.1 hypothetical protein GCM10007874_31720 [Labrys miyagiensis]
MAEPKAKSRTNAPEPKITKLSAMIATISFLAGLGGGILTEYAKASWAAQDQVMEDEVKEVRARISGYIDGAAKPQSEEDCQQLITTLTTYEKVYRSNQAQTLLKQGILIIQDAETNFSLAQRVGGAGGGGGGGGGSGPPPSPAVQDYKRGPKQVDEFLDYIKKPGPV